MQEEVHRSVLVGDQPAPTHHRHDGRDDPGKQERHPEEGSPWQFLVHEQRNAQTEEVAAYDVHDGEQDAEAQGVPELVQGGESHVIVEPYEGAGPEEVSAVETVPDPRHERPGDHGADEQDRRQQEQGRQEVDVDPLPRSDWPASCDGRRDRHEVTP